MIGAGTITDEQILGLRAEYLADRDLAGVDTCDVALGRHGASRNPRRVGRARGRLAKILRSRAVTHATKRKSPAQLDREIARALAEAEVKPISESSYLGGLRYKTEVYGPGGNRSIAAAPPSAFERANAESALLEQEMDAAQAGIDAFPRGAMGLPSESVRLSPEYQAAKARTDKAFARLRAFNAGYVKRFAKELRAARDQRYAERTQRHGKSD